MGWVAFQSTPPYAFNQSEMNKNNKRKKKTMKDRYAWIMPTFFSPHFYRKLVSFTLEIKNSMAKTHFLCH
jgi:hypothetical protein